MLNCSFSASPVESAQWLQFSSPPSRGRIEEGAHSASQIACLTFSTCFSTSSSQNLSTVNPFPLNQPSRLASYIWCLRCCPPSTSTTTCFSKQTKSTMYGPMALCLRNLCPQFGADEDDAKAPAPRLLDCFSALSLAL